MKRKKPVQPPAPAPAPEAKPLPALWERPAWDAARCALFALLLFSAMNLQTGRMSLILAVLAAALCIGRGPLRRFRERLGVPVLGLAAYALMGGFAAIYSPFGNDGVMDFYKLLAAFAVAVILLARFDKKHVRGLLWGIAAVCAVNALLCIDIVGEGPLFGVFRAGMEALGGNFESAVESSAGLRFNGIYNDANLTGAILGPAALISLYLVHSEEALKKRGLACLLLGVNAVGFLTAMSRGAILCLALAAPAYLLAEGKGGRLSLLLLMLFAGTAGALCGVLAMRTAGTPAAMLAAIAAGALTFLADWLAGRRLAGFLEANKLAAGAACALLAAGAVACGAVALRAEKPFVFTEFSRNGIMFRSAVLAPGEYALSGDWDYGEAAQVEVYSRSREQSLLNKEESLYRGPWDGAAFTVPEGAVRVYFQFWGEPGDEVRSLRLSNGAKIPAAYRFLPEGVARRLHEGLFTGHSYLERVQFDKDAWKLFLQSPLIGHGLSATEGLYTSVQPYYYESLYVHNFLLQAMTDMGLLGLAALLALVLGSAWLLLRRLREGRDPLAAALLACWVMLNSHSLMEINYSVRPFQCLCFALLLLPVPLYGRPLPEKAAKRGGAVLNAAVVLYLAVFTALLLSHRQVLREAREFSTSSRTEFLETLEGFIRRDVFDREDYYLSYVGNAPGNVSRYAGNVQRYVKALRRSGTYPACSGLARYYYLPRGEYAELFACSREGIAQEASNRDSWNLQLEFYRNEVLPAAGEAHMDEAAAGFLALRDYLEDCNVGRLEEIVLTRENRAFLDAVSEAVESGLSGGELFRYLTGELGYGQTEG